MADHQLGTERVMSQVVFNKRMSVQCRTGRGNSPLLAECYLTVKQRMQGMATRSRHVNPVEPPQSGPGNISAVTLKRCTSLPVE